ncbi:unnamed protein product [Allacma fusca]|uniref:DUF1308 domain-containing protein n=1 Tax=Allacma fusca TaxID=39272 RepID=A0A8J2Q4K4_9HEXA|nr:unnamed protein product [Allacma fusca]
MLLPKDITDSVILHSTFSNPLEPIPQHLKKVEGVARLKRSIEKELQIADEKCSNLPHLLSVVQCIQSPGHSQPSAVLKTFPFENGKTGKLTVDVVSLHGDEWCKVSARNPRSLQLLAAGGGGYGQKSIVDHAYEYLECAEENLCLFKPPKVTFVFTSGIGSSLAEELESVGVNVEGVRIEDELLHEHERIKDYKKVNFKNEDRESFEDEDSPLEVEDKFQFKNPDLSGVKKLNLDITALLAFVSNLTNGHTQVSFKKPILAEQLQFEIDRPQKPVLDVAFEGRELYCCETAMKEFQSILSIVGGPDEKIRAEKFVETIKVVPDCVSERAKSLVVGGHIKKRSLVIFATGDAIQAVTVTANSGFVRSAKSQGVDFPVFLHESRALTEGKENLETVHATKFIKSLDFYASDLKV